VARHRFPCYRQKRSPSMRLDKPCCADWPVANHVPEFCRKSSPPTRWSAARFVRGEISAAGTGGGSVIRHLEVRYRSERRTFQTRSA